MQTRYKALKKFHIYMHINLCIACFWLSFNIELRTVHAQDSDVIVEKGNSEQDPKQDQHETTAPPKKQELHQDGILQIFKQEAPLPSSKDIGGLAPNYRNVYPKTQLSRDKNKCKKKHGMWITSTNGLEGCMSHGGKDGFWIYKEGDFIQGVMSFERGVLNGEVWSFSLEGRALELITYKEGRKEGVSRKWDLGGQLKMVDYFKDDQRNGVSFGWHARSCIPAHRGAYKAGKKHGPWVTWYQTGAYREKGMYIDGIKQGNWSLYHQEGNKIKEGLMRDGKEQGTWQEWLHTGQKWRNVEFKDGVRQGVDELACLSLDGNWLVDHKERTESCQRLDYRTIVAKKTYYETGALLRRDTYNNKGGQTGLTQSFHPTGELLVEGQMEGGRPEGTFKYLKPSGEEMGSASTINQGTGKWTAYHASGVIAEQGEWLVGYPAGKWKTFYDHGGLESTVVYQDGRRNGIYKRYYRDGTVELEGKFLDNSRQGLWKFYYTNGQVAVEANFVQSMRSGSWKEWYWLSSPKVQGEYINNQKTGAWREFHNNGEIAARGSYSLDRKSGAWAQNWYTGSHWRDLSFTNGISDDPDESQCESIKGKWTAELKERYAGCQVCRVLPDGSNQMVKIGAWRWWHPNGKLEREGQFNEDQAHGSWQEYNREGKLILSGEYDRGKRMGLWQGYYPEGPRQYEGRFDDEGNEQGEWTTYFKEGGVDSRGLYEHGYRVGLWIWWNRQGRLAQIGQFRHSIPQKTKGLLPKSKHEHEETKPKPDPQVKVEGAEIKPKIEEQRSGTWLSWHNNCQLRTVGRYKEGDRDGLWRWWKSDGQGWRAENYLKSRSQGRAKEPRSVQIKQQKELQKLCQASRPLSKDLSESLMIWLQKEINEEPEPKSLVSKNKSQKEQFEINDEQEKAHNKDSLVDYSTKE